MLAVSGQATVGRSRKDICHLRVWDYDNFYVHIYFKFYICLLSGFFFFIVCLFCFDFTRILERGFLGRNKSLLQLTVWRFKVQY